MADEKQTDVPDEKIGQYWEYGFSGSIDGLPLYFYAFSEEEARKKYKDTFPNNAEPTLLSRRSW